MKLPRLSLRSVTFQTFSLIGLLALLLISRIAFGSILLDTFLIIVLIGLAATMLYFQKDRTLRALKTASVSLTDSKYADELSGDGLQADQALASIISEIALSHKSLDSSLDNIVDFTRKVSTKSDQISLGTEAQSFSMEETSTSIEGISSSIMTLVDMVEKLFPNAEKATRSILDMVDSNKKISSSTQELFSHVKDVSSHIDALVNSVEQVEKRFINLEKSSDETSASMERIDRTIKDVEDKAGLSSDLAAHVRADAEVGATASAKTIEGMSRIREIVSESAEVIQRLGEKSSEVGDIINVINDITDRTNLLALNASIIAAQAGEHGKGFAVVAEEIKRLADQTGQSTVEISDIVQGIQTMVSDVVQANEMGKWSAEEGVRLSNETGGALRKILESTSKSSEMSHLIAEATQNQSKETARVISALKAEVEVIKEVSETIREDARLSEKIRDSAKNMVEITRSVANSNMEQEKANTDVTKVIEDVKEMIQSMFDITRTQKTDSDQILQAIEIIKYISTENIDAIKELAGGAGELKDKIEELRTEFKEIGL